MKVAIIGAGAIGGLIAASFAEAGHTVSVTARGTHLEAIRTRGLTVRWLDGEPKTYRLPAHADPADLGEQDVVFIALKSYSIGAVLPKLAGILRPDSAVVPAINGLPWWFFQKLGGPYDRVKSPDPVLTAQQRADELHDMIGTVGSAFLGLTVGCARCHSHKFDPITQRDYYSLFSFFNTGQNY